MANEPFFTATGNYQAAEFRRLLATFYNVAAPGGILYGLGVVQSGSNVIIAAGACCITDTTNGLYVGDSTTASTLAIPSYVAGGSINRSDTVYVFVSETTGTELAPGVAANTPTIPVLAIPLATVTVTSAGITGVTLINAQAEMATVKGRYYSFDDHGWGYTGTDVNGNPTTIVASAGVTQAVHPPYNNYIPANAAVGFDYFGPEYRKYGKVVQVRGSYGNAGSLSTANPLFTIPYSITPRDTQVFQVLTDVNVGGVPVWDEVEVIGTFPNFGDPRTVGGVYPSYRTGASVWHFNMVWLLA